MKSRCQKCTERRVIVSNTMGLNVCAKCRKEILQKTKL